ncbi:DUF2306 domain-containing protein [Kitasatospora sp. GP82]|uniref:DUF2306 domain-containing protein n=1 Tax=Kitasatospora sp. GP82 TaxID=3035089 RepID=UPI002475A84C|nr:DUF2306 domain-containing protein [Kitasatospora sp. GP82]MDH6124885.1 uncharacterized membrane protein YozB (DUF420 family) [Kitasatospora sp. GP82]
MTRNTERTGALATGPRRARPSAGTATTAPSWWQSPWVAALAVLVVFNLLYAFPRYLTGGPRQARIPLDPAFPAHYAVLVGHVVFGNISLVTVFLQILPWIRRHYPAVHRMSGRVYIFAGALPGALLALVLVPYSTAPTGKLGLAVMGVLWLTTTVLGFRAVRRRRFVDHRRWMIYSFALALGTSWGRVVAELMPHIPGLRIGIMTFLDLANWAGWVLNLVIAHWWIERTGPRAAQLVR